MGVGKELMLRLTQSSRVGAGTELGKRPTIPEQSCLKKVYVKRFIQIINPSTGKASL